MARNSKSFDQIFDDAKKIRPDIKQYAAEKWAERYWKKVKASAVPSKNDAPDVLVNCMLKGEWRKAAELVSKANIYGAEYHSPITIRRMGLKLLEELRDVLDRQDYLKAAFLWASSTAASKYAGSDSFVFDDNLATIISQTSVPDELVGKLREDWVIQRPYRPQRGFLVFSHGLGDLFPHEDAADIQGSFAVRFFGRFAKDDRFAHSISASLSARYTLQLGWAQDWEGFVDYIKTMQMHLRIRGGFPRHIAAIHNAFSEVAKKRSDESGGKWGQHIESLNRQYPALLAPR